MFFTETPVTLQFSTQQWKESHWSVPQQFHMLILSPHRRITNDQQTLHWQNKSLYCGLLARHELLLLQLLLWYLWKRRVTLSEVPQPSHRSHRTQLLRVLWCFHVESKGVLRCHHGSCITFVFVSERHFTFFFWATSSSGLGTICSFSVRIISMWQGELM